MWDGGINHIEVMPIAPFTDTVEMGMDIGEILNFLQSDQTYPLLFEKAFGTKNITDQKMLYALAQFMSTMVSADAKYDQYILGRTNLSNQEMRGLFLFRQHCESCHQEPLFTNFEFINNGTDKMNSPDHGRARITQETQDIGKYRVPTLRNIALTYPYMHNGEIPTLEAVLEHYTSPLDAVNLDPALAGGLSISSEDKKDIIAFLHTLSDFNFIGNPIFSDPN